MPPTRALVIINPAAKSAKRCKPDHVREVLERHGLDVTVELSGRPDEPAREARSNGFDRVIAAGGDGTLRSVACSTDLPVGILPVGTSNSVARSLGIPIRVDDALRVAALGNARKADLGVVSGPEIEGGEQSFLLCASAGVDAEAARRYETKFRSSPSVPRYAMTVFDALFTYRPAPIRTTVDGHGPLPPSSIAIASNMKIYGGWFVMCPEAVPFDGVLDLILVRTEGPVGLLGALSRAYARREQTSTRVNQLQTTKLRWETDGRVPIQIDGEPIGWLPADVSIRPGAITLMVP